MDTCGSESAGLFGYIALTMSPSGTSPFSTTSTIIPTSVLQTVSTPTSAGLKSSKFMLPTSIQITTVIVQLSPSPKTIFSTIAVSFLGAERYSMSGVPNTFFLVSYCQSKSCDCSGNSDGLAFGSSFYHISSMVLLQPCTALIYESYSIS